MNTGSDKWESNTIYQNIWWNWNWWVYFQWVSDTLACFYDKFNIRRKIMNTFCTQQFCNYQPDPPSIRQSTKRNYLHTVNYPLGPSLFFLFLPLDISWSTWSYKIFTGHLHAPNHTSCIMQGSSWWISQPLSSLFSAPPPFHSLSPTSWFQALEIPPQWPLPSRFPPPVLPSCGWRWKFDSCSCCLMKSFQHRAGPPSELNLQFCFLFC